MLKWEESSDTDTDTDTDSDSSEERQRRRRRALVKKVSVNEVRRSRCLQGGIGLGPVGIGGMVGLADWTRSVHTSEGFVLESRSALGASVRAGINGGPALTASAAVSTSTRISSDRPLSVDVDVNVGGNVGLDMGGGVGIGVGANIGMSVGDRPGLEASVGVNLLGVGVDAGIGTNGLRLGVNMGPLRLGF
ncbi:hypothetical protein GJAV_G00248580 [Gymnothorax javanicus]|nr:hypothetical protein GJAV_G00248580 [Gymnothorax javanicus]